MLVAKERRTRAIMATVTPGKGETIFLADRVMAFMREVGCELEEVTVKKRTMNLRLSR